MSETVLIGDPYMVTVLIHLGKYGDGHCTVNLHVMQNNCTVAITLPAQMEHDFIQNSGHLFLGDGDFLNI